MVVILFCLYGSGVFACKCAVNLRSVTERFLQANIVFTGKIQNVEIVQKNGHPLLKIKIRPIRVWKGSKSTELVVYTGMGGGDCGFDKPIVGKEYYVIAEDENLSICGDTFAPATETDGFFRSLREIN